MTTWMRRLVKLGATFLGGATLIGVSAAVAILLYLRSAEDRSVLSPGEWEKLRARLSESHATEPKSTDVAADRTEPPEPPPASARRERAPLDPEVLRHQLEAYAAHRAKSVVELQPFRSSSTTRVVRAGGLEGRATLVNLNPVVNRWYLLLAQWADGREDAYHLVNAEPHARDLELHPSGLALVDSAGEELCDLWSDAAPLSLDAASRSSSPYVSLCLDQVTLRLKTPGRRTTLEWATDFLRDNVWGGERLTVLVRQSFFQDKYLTTGELAETEGGGPRFAEGEDVPSPARLAEPFAGAALDPAELGLAVEGAVEGQLAAGRWHRARFHPGVFASVVSPGLIHPEILRSQPNVVAALDEVEREALVYLVAFDLSLYDLGFGLGTEHPRVGWSGRALESVRDPSLPGPDGIEDIAPLVATGIVPPFEAERTVATFTGGFKRDHGAFRVSELATRNQGSHYGFVESGAILSKLQPGLATLLVLDDGGVELRTWSVEDEPLLPQILHARQNGLPVVETDLETGATVAGARVA